MSGLACVTSSNSGIRSFGPHLITENIGTSADAINIATTCSHLAHHFATPFSRVWASPIVRFNSYRDQWESETKFISSAVDIAMNPAYQKIIGMGKQALPMILNELKEKPGHWFWALKAISGEDPVPAELRGRVKKMTEAWIKWGTEKRLI